MAINNGYEMDDKCCPNCGEAPILDGGACPELDAAYQTLNSEFGDMILIFNDSYQYIQKGVVSNEFRTPRNCPYQYQIGEYLVTIQKLPQEKYDGVPADTHSI